MCFTGVGTALVSAPVFCLASGRDPSYTESEPAWGGFLKGWAPRWCPPLFLGAGYAAIPIFPQELHAIRWICDDAIDRCLRQRLHDFDRIAAAEVNGCHGERTSQFIKWGASLLLTLVKSQFEPGEQAELRITISRSPDFSRDSRTVRASRIDQVFRTSLYRCSPNGPSGSRTNT